MLNLDQMQMWRWSQRRFPSVPEPCQGTATNGYLMSPGHYPPPQVAGALHSVPDCSSTQQDVAPAGIVENMITGAVVVLLLIAAAIVSVEWLSARYPGTKRAHGQSWSGYFAPARKPFNEDKDEL